MDSQRVYTPAEYRALFHFVQDLARKTLAGAIQWNWHYFFVGDFKITLEDARQDYGFRPVRPGMFDGALYNDPQGISISGPDIPGGQIWKSLEEWAMPSRL